MLFSYPKAKRNGTLDDRTCKVCAGMNGKVIPLSQYKPGATVPPFHPNCRGTTCPHFDGEQEVPKNANGESIPEDMTYEEWKKRFVDGDKSGLTLSVVDDILKMRIKS